MKTFNEFIEEVLGQKIPKDWNRINEPTKYSVIETLNSLITDPVIKELEDRVDPKWIAENRPTLYHLVRLTIYYQAYVVDEMSERKAKLDKVMGIK